MRRQLLIAGLILAAAALAAFLLVTSREEPPAAEPVDTAPLVQTTPIEFRSGPLTVSGGGTVEAIERTALAPQVGGRVAYVNPDLLNGARVARGEILLRIDQSDYSNAVEAARADVEQQRVNVTQAEEEVRLAAREAERFAGRRAALSTPAGVDSSDYAARILPPPELADMAGAAGPGDTALDEQAAPELSELASRRPQLRAAEAALAGARSRLADARLALSRTVIRSPFSGIVATENVGPGTYVSPGQTVAELASTSAYEVVVPLSAAEAALLPRVFAEGGRRYLASVFYTYGGRRYRWNAFVDRADGVLNEDTRTIDVYLRIPAPLTGGELADEQGDAADNANVGAALPAPPLLIGSYVEAEIQGEELERYAAVPLAGLREDDTVWLVENGRVRIEELDVIQQDDRFAYARGDALEGARLITGGVNIATEGMEVRLTADRQASGRQSAVRRRAPAEGARQAERAGQANR